MTRAAGWLAVLSAALFALVALGSNEGLGHNNLASVERAKRVVAAWNLVSDQVKRGRSLAAGLDYLLPAAGEQRAAEWLFGWAQLFWKAGNTAKTVEVLDLLQDRDLARVLSNDERARAAGLWCAIVLAGLPTAEQGLSHLEKALQISPNYADALALKGIALAQLGRRDEGAPLVQQAIQLASGKDQALMRMRSVHFYVTAGEMSQAEFAARDLIARYPDYADGLRTMAYLLMRSGRCAEAISYAQQATALAATQAAMWRTLGDAQWCSGEKAAAADAYRKAIALAPAYADLLRARLDPQP